MIDNELDPGRQPMTPANPPAEIDTYKLQRFTKRVKEEQNLSLALIGGFGAAVFGALFWAAITVITDYQIGWMAVGVGFLVGFAVRLLGKGLDKIYGFVGAGFALVGCLLGNFLATVAIIAQIEAVSIIDVLSFLFANLDAAIELMGIAFSPIDLLFYAIAIYQGYKLSFRHVTQAEIDAAMNAPI